MMQARRIVLAFLMSYALVAGGCDDSTNSGADATDTMSDSMDSDGETEELEGPPSSLRIMTFNAGTTDGLKHDEGDDDYTQEMSDVVDEYYDNSLSWPPAEERLKEFIAEQNPDIAAFQELFYDPLCDYVPSDIELGLLCETQPSEPPQIQIRRLMGPDYTILCGSPGEQPDNCIAIRTTLGNIENCPQSGTCVGLLVSPTEGCSSQKYGLAEVTFEDNTRLAIVNVHGRSGVTQEDFDCRSDQFERIFNDAGDGEPLANGDSNIVLGDINTDPFFFENVDDSAAVWSQYVGEDKPYHYISSSNEDGPGTSLGSLRIDHVTSDSYTGSCTVFGSSPNTAPLLPFPYWDHKPLVCDTTL